MGVEDLNAGHPQLLVDPETDKQEDPTAKSPDNAHQSQGADAPQIAAHDATDVVATPVVSETPEPAPLSLLETLKSLSTEIVKEVPALSEHTAALLHQIGGEQMVQVAQENHEQTPQTSTAEIEHHLQVLNEQNHAEHLVVDTHIDAPQDAASLRDDVTHDITHHVDTTHHHS